MPSSILVVIPSLSPSKLLFCMKRRCCAEAHTHTHTSVQTKTQQNEAALCLKPGQANSRGVARTQCSQSHLGTVFQHGSPNDKWVWVKTKPPGLGPQVFVLGSNYQGPILGLPFPFCHGTLRQRTWKIYQLPFLLRGQVPCQSNMGAHPNGCFSKVGTLQVQLFSLPRTKPRKGLPDFPKFLAPKSAWVTVSHLGHPCEGPFDQHPNETKADLPVLSRE